MTVTAAGSERARAAKFIAALDTGSLADDWTHALADAGVLRDIAPTRATVLRIVTGLQRGLALHLEAPRAKLDVGTGALADDAAVAHLQRRGVKITHLTEGVFAFMDVTATRLEDEGLYVPAVAHLLRDFGKRFLRSAGEAWSGILLAERTEAERARAELRRILEATTDGILLVGKDLALRFANGRCSELLGVALDEHIGENAHHLLVELVGPRLEEPERFLARTRHLYGTMEEVADDEVTVLMPPRTLARHSAPVRDAQGQTIGRIELYRDVTAERQARRQRDEFLGLVGHELRTPLAAISGYVDLAARGLAKIIRADPTDQPQVERVGQYLTRSKANVERLVRLVDTLLTVERFESGRWPLDLRRVDLAAVVAQSVSNYAGAASRQIGLVVPDAPVMVRGDPDRLEQVVANLLSNALRHASPGFTVQTQLVVEGDEAALRVSDDGAGIPLRERERIFERFYRLPEGGLRSGLGLGLFVVRQLAIAHGGSASVDDREGGGSCLVVRLPLAKEPREERLGRDERVHQP